MTTNDYTHFFGKRVQVTFRNDTKENTEIGVLTNAVWLTTDEGKTFTFDPEAIEVCPEPKPQRELPTTPGTVVRVGEQVWMRGPSNWMGIDVDHDIFTHITDEDIASLNWQLLVPAPDEPQEPQIVVDAEGADWIRRSDGTYREACAIWCVGDNPTLDELRKDSGPLTLPDGSPL